MDHSANLRYYECLFIKTINQYFTIYKPDKISTFMDLLSSLSGANQLHLMQAVGKVVTNDPSVRIFRDEYIILLHLYSGLNASEIKRLLKCGHATYSQALEQYDNKTIHITPKFSIVQSNEIRKAMEGLRAFNHIY